MPEVPPTPEGPPMWERVRDTLGLDFKAPKGAGDNLKYSLGVLPFLRDQIGKVMSLGNTERNTER